MTAAAPPSAATSRPSIVLRAYHKFKLVAAERGAGPAARGLARMHFRLLRGTQSVYQPLLLGGTLVGHDSRDVARRWSMIEPHLPPDARTALDLGCAQGFFALQLARRGLTSIGVDNMPTSLDMAWHQARLNDVGRVGFIRADITPEFVDSLPESDIVMFLSLFHHLMYIHGVEWAAELMQRVRRKTKQAMFLDMGQSNEYMHEFHAWLPDMGPDPGRWIIDFLKQQGFTGAEVIGSVPADKYKDPNIQRALVKAW